MSEYHNYSFKVDGCLPVASRAPSQKVAEERIRRMWPRSKIEFIGIDLPSADRGLPQPKGNLRRPVSYAPNVSDIASRRKPKDDGMAHSGDYADAINEAIAAG